MTLIPSPTDPTLRYHKYSAGKAGRVVIDVEKFDAEFTKKWFVVSYIILPEADIEELKKS